MHRLGRALGRLDRGFTLIEMMVTVVLLGVLIALVTPSFRDLLRDNRAATQANALVGSLMLARSEAVKRNVPVVACQSDDAATCGGEADAWAAGWLVWPDTDRDGALDNDGDDVPEANEEPIIQSHAALTGRFDLGAAAASVTYNPDGSVVADADFELVPPDSSDADHGRCIAIDATGRPTVTKGACP